jgi:hypothetical protein
LIVAEKSANFSNVATKDSHLDCRAPLILIVALQLTVERRVSHEGMVSVGGNLYSVPDTARKRVLEVQSHPSQVRIFEAGQLIACHPVLEGRNQRRVDPSHRKAPPSARHDPQQPLPHRTGSVGQRPLAFYDAVARRLASQELRR